MINLVCLHGTGDTYLVCALAAAVKHQHGDDVTIIVKSTHAAIPEMFGLRYEVSDEIVSLGETDAVFQTAYENHYAFNHGQRYYVHPTFLRSGVRIDHLTVKPSVSQADMYRVLLHLPPDAPMTVPKIEVHRTEPNSVLIIPTANSWPNSWPQFWIDLGKALKAAGRDVTFNFPNWTLRELLDRCATSEWVIGPQCGVMSILCEARFPCRKTFCTPSIDGGRYPGLPLERTFPYAYVTKFAGNDYDVEEFKIDSSYENEIDAIVSGANFQRSWPHDPAPVMTVNAPMSPGDFLDRLAILSVKERRFPPEKRAFVMREFLRLGEMLFDIPLPSDGFAGLQRLKSLHSNGFDAVDRFVRGATTDGGLMSVEDHAHAVRLNKERVGFKQEIDRACHAPFSETKSYYSKP